MGMKKKVSVKAMGAKKGSGKKMVMGKVAMGKGKMPPFGKM